MKSHNFVKKDQYECFCYKKSQPSERKSHKTVNLSYKQSQSSVKEALNCKSLL